MTAGTQHPLDIQVIDATSITIEGTLLTTVQVEQLIHDLAVIRNALRPEVPQDFRHSRVNALVQHDPDLQVGLTVDGHVALSLRHRALGWYVFTMTKERAAQLRDFFAKRTKGVTGQLLDEQVGDPNRSH